MPTIKSAVSKLDQWQRWLSDRHIGSMVVYGLAFFTAGLGTAMLLTPETFLRAPTFTYVFLEGNFAAPPAVWGLLFIFSAFMMVGGYFANRANGRPGALGLTLLYAAFATLCSVSPFNGQGVFSAWVVYSALSYFSMVSLIACNDPKDSHATP